MKYPCVVLYVKGNNVSPYPFMVEANDEVHATGLAHKIGEKLRPEGTDFHIKVGKQIPVTVESAILEP